MKLNHDCVRDVLLYIEENASYSNTVNQEVIATNFQNHDKFELIYAIEKLYETNYINGSKHNALNGPYPFFNIVDISYDGHEFLDNIRNDNVWTETKQTILENIGSASLSIVSTVAAAITTRWLGL